MYRREIKPSSNTKDLNMNVHSNFIYKSPKLETTQCPLVAEWIKKLRYTHKMESTQQKKQMSSRDMEKDGEMSDTLG